MLSCSIWVFNVDIKFRFPIRTLAEANLNINANYDYFFGPQIIKDNTISIYISIHSSILVAKTFALTYIDCPLVGGIKIYTLSFIIIMFSQGLILTLKDCN